MFSVKRFLNLRLLSILYFFLILFLFLYSFTQVDLGLTLTRHPFWQPIQHFFQFIGYFDRPLSAFLYIVILLFMYLFYAVFLFLAHKQRLGKKYAWGLILATAVILAFSYNAFSYDLFNYIFDAKIITHYQQNPYLRKALDYPGDPMLSFMHWTHSVYPYGPFWLVLTVPLSFLGLNFFLPTFFLFKFLMSASFLGSAYFLSRVMEKINPSKEIFATVFFAFNPLVIIESLVSAHNDIVMMFFAIFSFYLLLKNKYLFSAVAIIVSIGIKFATAFTLPVYFLIFFLLKRKRAIDKKIYAALILVMIPPIAIASLRTNFQPWYLLYALPFAAILSFEYFVLIPFFIASFVYLLEYVPFLYLGNWNPPVPSILSLLTLLGILLGFVIVFFWFIIRTGKNYGTFKKV